MSERYDVSLRTLRFYEELGFLSPVRIGCQRFYSAKDEIRLQIVITGKRLGLKLDLIRSLIDEYVRIRGKDPTDIKNIIDPVTLKKQVKSLAAHKDALDDTLSKLRGFANSAPHR